MAAPPTVTDSNGVLDNYKFESCLPGVTVTTSGNKLTLSTTNAIMSPKTSSPVKSADTLAGGKGAVAVWRTADRNFQDFATYYKEGGDPVSCYIKVKTDAVGSAGLVKTSEDGKVEGIQFQITGSDGSSTTKTTDASGNIDIDGLPKPEAEWNDETGTWFGLTTEDWMVETQDGLCALPYDYYTLEELRCEGNKGYALVTVPNIFISRDNTVIELGTIDDHEEGTPEIGTTATVDGEKSAEPLSEITLVDTVRYSGLTVGKTYKLSGVLMDKATGEPLTVDGKQVTAEKEFTPKSKSGTEELS